MRLWIHMQGGTTKNYSVVLNHRVVGDVLFYFCTVSFDQRAIFLERLNELNDARHIVDRRFSQFLQLFIDDHSANAIVDINLQQQSTVHGERQNVATLNPMLTGTHAML